MYKLFHRYKPYVFLKSFKMLIFLDYDFTRFLLCKMITCKRTPSFHLEKFFVDTEKVEWRTFTTTFTHKHRGRLQNRPERYDLYLFVGRGGGVIPAYRKWWEWTNQKTGFDEVSMDEDLVKEHVTEVVSPTRKIQEGLNRHYSTEYWALWTGTDKGYNLIITSSVSNNKVNSNWSFI